MRHTHITLRKKLSLSEICVTARKGPLTCGKPVTGYCVTRNSRDRAAIVTLRVTLRNRVASQLFPALTCMFIDHLRDCYAVTQKRESPATPDCDMTTTTTKENSCDRPSG